MTESYQLIKTAPQLRDYISHYWLGLDNRQTITTILPDGAVDLVIEISGTGLLSRLYGTTTRPIELELCQGNHYLGIQFKAGQSRHFINSNALDLTNTSIDSSGVIDFPTDEIENLIEDGSLAAALDRCFLSHIARIQPQRTRLDTIIGMIEKGRTKVSVGELAINYGKSRRQFERDFREAVGLSPKLFALIKRYQFAADLMQYPNMQMSAIAMEAGYSDQSHMTRDFGRLAGRSPINYQTMSHLFKTDE